MFKRIAVVLAGNALPNETIETIIALARFHEARTNIVSLIDNRRIEADAAASGRKPDAVREEYISTSWFEAYRIEESFREQNLPAGLGVLVAGSNDDYTAIINQTKADLVVICKPGAEMLGRLEKILRAVEMPVLIIP